MLTTTLVRLTQTCIGTRKSRCIATPVSTQTVSRTDAFDLTLTRTDPVLSSDESYHVCHEGYISLFPFLLSLLEPSSPHLGPVLALLRDPDQLWSPYGIRSLSKSHPLFGKGEDYWRGPIWIQMNYLALGALYNVSFPRRGSKPRSSLDPDSLALSLCISYVQKYAKEPGPQQALAGEIYAELRDNVINNVYKVSRCCFVVGARAVVDFASTCVRRCD